MSYFAINDSMNFLIGTYDNVFKACSEIEEFDSTGEDIIIVGPSDDLLCLNELSKETIEIILKNNDIEPLEDRFENLEILSILLT